MAKVLILGGGFAGVVDNEHRERVCALQLAQVRKQRCDLSGCVLVDAVQAHERIEDQ